MVRRLNAGLPVFPERWIGSGGLILVACAIIEVFQFQ